MVETVQAKIIVKLSPCKTQQQDCKYLIRINGKKIGFGQYGASDYTIHKDIERKELYINRHQKIESKFWDLSNESNYLTRSFWSRYLLWKFDDIYKAIQYLEQNTDMKINYTKSTIDKHQRLLKKLAVNNAK